MKWFAKARNTDPKTSHAAADSVRNITATHKFVLALIEVHGPLNDEDLLALYLDQVGVISPSGLRSRRSELVDRGLVVDSGERVKMLSGRNSIVWKVA